MLRFLFGGLWDELQIDFIMALLFSKIFHIVMRLLVTRTCFLIFFLLALQEPLAVKVRSMLRIILLQHLKLKQINHLKCLVLCFYFVLEFVLLLCTYTILGCAN